MSLTVNTLPTTYAYDTVEVAQFSTYLGQVITGPVSISTLVGTNAAGCDSLLLTQVYLDDPLWNDETIEENALTVQPWDANGLFTITWTPQHLRAPSHGHLYSSEGRLLQRHRLAPDAMSLDVDLSSYPAGLYWVALHGAGTTRSVRLWRH